MLATLGNVETRYMYIFLKNFCEEELQIFAHRIKTK